MQNNNSSISQDINRIFDLKGESTNLVSDIIMPVVPIVRQIDIVRNGTSSASGALTAYTTPSDKDFYLTGIFLNISCDAASDWVTASYTATIQGVSRAFAYIAKLTLTATQQQVSIQYPIPIKIDRGTNIVNSLTFAAGNTIRAYSLQGYTVETTK